MKEYYLQKILIPFKHKGDNHARPPCSDINGDIFPRAYPFSDKGSVAAVTLGLSLLLWALQPWGGTVLIYKPEKNHQA